MSMHRLKRFRAALALAAAGTALSCGGTTAPATDSTPVRYDVTANIKEYFFPVITPGCSSTGCGHDSVASPNSTLSGTVELDANRPVTSGDGTYKVAAVSLIGSSCRSGTSCTTTEFVGTSTGFVVAADTLSEPAWFFSGGSEYIVLGSGRAAGDSITGRFSWMLNGGTATSGYSGTYVARRHR